MSRYIAAAALFGTIMCIGEATDTGHVHVASHLDTAIMIDAGGGASKVDANKFGFSILEHALIESINKQEVTPGVKTVLKQIVNLTKDKLMPVVKAAHDVDQQTLDTLQTSLETACSTKERMVDINISYRTFENKSSYHRQCRNTEKADWDEWQACKNKPDDYDPCTNDTIPVNTSVCRRQSSSLAPGQDETYEEYLRRVTNHFWLKKQENILWKTLFCNHTNHTRPNCTSLRYKYLQTQERCNRIQNQMDDRACTWKGLVKQKCEASSSCWNSTRTNFLSQKANLQGNEEDRKREWKLLKRVYCLAEHGVDHVTGKIDMSNVTMCNQMVVNTSYFNLKYPEVPPIPPQCNVTVHPCTESYLASKPYTGFPSPPINFSHLCQPCAWR